MKPDQPIKRGRGRPMGSKAMQTNSWNAVLSRFEVGDREYIETTLEDYSNVMRTANVPSTRRSVETQDMVFKTELFTAVGVGKAGVIRYLVCLERIL